MGPIQGVRSDLWLLTREDLRDVPRVRAFIDFLAEYVSGMRRLLTGEAAL
jgi:DNA-binding transcriptional LysR family regulator